MRRSLYATIVMWIAFSICVSAQETVSDKIDGSVSGVYVSSIDGAPDGARNINVRGLNSLRGNNMPLWVVDGCIIGTSAMQNLEAFFQYGENSYTNPFDIFGYLNVNDIEKIEVLKNTSATALYGSKGANGVILITTRKGDREENFSVDWRSKVGVSVADGKIDGTKPAVSHDHHARISGMLEKAGYSVSAFYKDVNGVVPGTSSQRGGLRTNFETKTNNVIWFGLNSSLAISSIDTPLTGAWYGMPSLGTALRGIQPVGATEASVEDYVADYDDSAKDFRTTNSMYLAVNILPQLQWKTTFGLDFDNDTRYIWYGSRTPFGAEYNGAASIVTSKTLSYNGQTRLDYRTYIGEKHQIKASAAALIEGDWNKFSTMNGTNFWTHAMRAQGLAIAGSKAVIRDFNYRYFHFGAYASLEYDYAGIAGIRALTRVDSTPKYDDDRMAVYPSVEAWFDIKKLWTDNSEILSALSLTAGWGRSGRESFVPYQLLSQYTTGKYPEVGNDVAYFYESLNKLNSSEFNIAVDLGFLKDRIRMRLGYYRKSTSDNINMYCFGAPGKDGIVWENTPRENIYNQSASINNNGLELDLTAQIIKTPDWNWTVGLNASYNENQLTHVDIPDRLGREVGSGVLANVNVLGYSVGCIYGYDINPDGSYKDQTSDGKITAVDKVILGNTQPKVFGMFDSFLSYKDFSLDMQFKAALGHKLLNMNRMLEDKQTEVSRIYAENADYFRLGRVTFTYDLPFVRDVKWIKSINVFATAYNLFTITRYSGWNPDVNSFGISNLSTGFDYGSYPMTRTFMLGVNLNF